MKFWYQHHFYAKLLAFFLLPISCLFGVVIWLRRKLYQWGVLKSFRANVPVIVVGNLSVGGNGKTPVTLWLTKILQQHGLRVGIISRGYGSRSPFYPRLVKIDDLGYDVGDEPLLLAQRSGVPVCIGANRKQAIELLQAQHAIDVVISDDGLQHYALQRDIEIVVVESERKFGNGFLMPAGALREPLSRLNTVDFIIAHGEAMRCADSLMYLVPSVAVNVKTGEARPLAEFYGRTLNAMAGIGNPQRFFRMLEEQGMNLQHCHTFLDHQAFTPQLLAQFSPDLPLFMTEKDAVKCRTFAKNNWWYVPVEAEISGKIVPKIGAWAEQQKMRNPTDSKG